MDSPWSEATGEEVSGDIGRVQCPILRHVSPRIPARSGSVWRRGRSREGEHFADDAAARLALDMHDKIDGFCNLGFGIGEGRLRVVAHDQIGEAMQGLLRRIGVDRRERSGMAGVEGIEQRARLDSAHFAQDDAVRSPAESGLEKVVESDVGLERIGLAFDGQNVRLLDLQFRSIFDDDDALMIRNEIASIRRSVVFPVPVPPLISSVFPLRICSARRSASGRVSVPRAMRSSTV
jgi:hypothetical protein